MIAFCAGSVRESGIMKVILRMNRQKAEAIFVINQSITNVSVDGQRIYRMELESKFVIKSIYNMRGSFLGKNIGWTY